MTASVGRPTEYKPEYCEKVIEYGKQGKSVAQIASLLNVAKSSLYAWQEANPEFSNAMATSRDFCLAWWEDIGQDSLTADKFQSALWAKQVSCRFPQDYREKTEVTTINLTPEQALRQLMGEHE